MTDMTYEERNLRWTVGRFHAAVEYEKHNREVPEELEKNIRESNHVHGHGSYANRLEATAKHLQKVRENEKKQRIDKVEGPQGLR